MFCLHRGVPPKFALYLNHFSFPYCIHNSPSLLNDLIAPGQFPQPDLSLRLDIEPASDSGVLSDKFGRLDPSLPFEDYICSLILHPLIHHGYPPGHRKSMTMLSS